MPLLKGGILLLSQKTALQYQRSIRTGIIKTWRDGVPN